MQCAWGSPLFLNSTTSTFVKFTPNSNCQWLISSYVSFLSWKQLILYRGYYVLIFLLWDPPLISGNFGLQVIVKTYLGFQPLSKLLRCPVPSLSCICHYLCTLKAKWSSFRPWPSLSRLQIPLNLQELVLMTWDLMNEVYLDFSWWDLSHLFFTSDTDRYYAAKTVKQNTIMHCL